MTEGFDMGKKIIACTISIAAIVLLSVTASAVEKCLMLI